MAPVSIGNSIRGTSNKITTLKDGCRIIGRDLAFSLQATGSTITGWTPIGGIPLTPAALNSSVLRGYTQMFNKFKINRVVFHYITSSSTAQAGDVMFYHEKNRTDPFPDFSNSSFLPFVLSDPNTVIGPQWTNHSVSFVPTDSFNSTDYGTNVDVNEESSGSIFLFSKTPSANSPGYVLVDYDITFKELSVNPRAGLLPNPRITWYCTSLGAGSSAVTVGQTMGLSIHGNTYTGIQAVAPSGIQNGEIFKVVLDITNARILANWSNCTVSNLMAYKGVGGSSTTTAITLDDGFTLYVSYDSGSGSYICYPTLTAALADSNPLVFGVTATIGFNLTCWMSVVSCRAITAQSSY